MQNRPALTTVRFHVAGLPTPSGSRRVAPIRRRDGSVSYRLVSDRRVYEWVATVRCRAEDAMRGHPPWDGPICVRMVFQFPRPLAHYRGGRRDAGRLRPDAPTLVVKRPDVDKLARAVLDALTGVVWLDDAQVAMLTAEKRYADEPGVDVTVERVYMETGR